MNETVNYNLLKEFDYIQIGRFSKKSNVHLIKVQKNSYNSQV